MSEVQLRPLLFALTASLLCLYVLVIVWPRFFPPPPAPFVEGILREIRAQNYEVVYSHLAHHWKGPADVRSFVDAHLKQEEDAVRAGGFVETTAIAAEKVQVESGAALVPVSYRVKVIATPPRYFERHALVRLVYEQTRWRVDSLIFK
jgi:hypothetical protein